MPLLNILNIPPSHNTKIQPSWIAADLSTNNAHSNALTNSHSKHKSSIKQNATSTPKRSRVKKRETLPSDFVANDFDKTASNTQDDIFYRDFITSLNNEKINHDVRHEPIRESYSQEQTLRQSSFYNPNVYLDSLMIADEVDIPRKNHQRQTQSFLEMPIISEPSSMNGPVDESYLSEHTNISKHRAASDSDESFATSRATSRLSVASDLSVLNQQNPLRILQPIQKVSHAEMFKNRMRDIESRRMPTYAEDDNDKDADKNLENSLSQIDFADSDDFGTLLNYHLFEEMNHSQEDID